MSVETSAQQVKQEPREDVPVKKEKVKERAPPDELYIYSAEELAQFKKRELIADAELLDGMNLVPSLISCC